MSSYDEWLERPYQRAADESEAFINWCVDNDLDHHAPASFDAWLEVREEERAEQMIEQHEALLERIEDERDEEDE